MKFLDKKPGYCMKCHACESTCARTYFQVKDHEKAALRILEKASGKPDMLTCTQCGDCMLVCPTNAIYRDSEGIVLIDTEKCISCFLCVEACPEKAMFQHPDEKFPFKCNSCGKCIWVCATGAIFMNS